MIDTIVETVGAFPYFTYNIFNCGDSVRLTDATTLSPGWTITNITWTGAIAASGLITSVSGTLSPGTHTETEYVTYVDTTDTVTCFYPGNIVIPSTPAGSALFTASADTICTNVPVFFTPVSIAGIASFYWNFGDSSTSLLDSTQRTYTYLAIHGNPNKDTVVLTVTDSLGCIAKDTVIIHVYDNVIGGNISPTTSTACSNNEPITLTILPAGSPLATVSYLWSNGGNTSSINVDTSGTYNVIVTGQYQCQHTLPLLPAAPTIVRIIPSPGGSINGPLMYCVGTPTATLYDNLGPEVSYKWYLNGTLSSTASSVSIGGATSPEHYPVMLAMSMTDTVSGLTCTDTLRDTVRVLPPPPAPVITGPVAVSCAAYELALTATDSLTGFYNWSNGTTGSVDDVYSGGAYLVTFTDSIGCQSSTSVTTPQNPANFFAYFPSGCYDLCTGQLPLTLYGPPNEDFHQWSWLKGGAPVDNGPGVGVMPFYAVTVAATYNWGLSDSLCPAVESPAMNLSTLACTNCGAAPTATLTCTSGNEASYSMKIVLTSPAAGSTFVLGTSEGPVVPFSGTLPAAATYTLSLTYTTLAVPPLSNVEVEIHWTLPSGAQCFQEVKVAVPSCTWTAERTTGNDSGEVQANNLQQIASAMLVYPNPTTGSVTISYDYGTLRQAQDDQRSIDIYDEMGNKRQGTVPADAQGTWQVNTAGWTPGIYIIRMVGDGVVLQTQRLVVTN